MIKDIALLIIGLGLLLKCSEFLVHHAGVIAKRAGVSEWLIGLTLLAFGSSLPEWLVSLYAAIKGSSGIAVSNISGSITANTLIVIGLSCLIARLPISDKIIRFEMPFLFFLCCLTSVLIFIPVSQKGLGHADGFVLLFIFAVFMFVLIRRSTPEVSDTAGLESMWVGVLFSAGGLIGVLAGAQLVVNAASSVAESLGVGESFIGFTIVAFGTSLPEAVISCAAAMKGKTDMALANVVGSNIFNVVMVLGSAAAVSGLSYTNADIRDWGVAVAAVAALLISSLVLRRSGLGKRFGFVFALIYIMYIVFITYEQFTHTI